MGYVCQERSGHVRLLEAVSRAIERLSFQRVKRSVYWSRQESKHEFSIPFQWMHSLLMSM